MQIVDIFMELVGVFAPIVVAYVFVLFGIDLVVSAFRGGR